MPADPALATRCARAATGYLADPAISLAAQTPADAAGTGLYRGDSAQALIALRAPALSCQPCDLRQTRTHVVFGEGSPTARLIIFGEAPGEEEDKTGRPFQGRAGKMLPAARRGGHPARRYLDQQTVKCRPTNRKDVSSATRAGGRGPRLRDLAHRRDGAAAPASVCCLGATAAKTILGREVKMTQERGNGWPGPTARNHADLSSLLCHAPGRRGLRSIHGEALADLQAIAARLAEV